MTTIEDQDLRESLELGLIDPFRVMMGKMYTFGVSWDQFDPDATGSMLLRADLTAFLAEVKRFVRRYKGHGELDAALDQLISVIDNYYFTDRPVFDPEGRFDGRRSIVRSDYPTGNANVDAAKLLLQTEDREVVLSVARGRLAEDIDMLRGGPGWNEQGGVRSQRAQAKLQWEGTLVSLTTIVQDLVAKGWITLPTSGGLKEGSWEILAERLHSIFDVAGNLQKETTLASWKASLKEPPKKQGENTPALERLKVLPKVDDYRGRTRG